MSTEFDFMQSILDAQQTAMKIGRDQVRIQVSAWAEQNADRIKDADIEGLLVLLKTEMLKE